MAESGGLTPYFEIPKPFVVNINGEDPIVFLQVNAQLKTTDPHLKKALLENLPAIRHTMIMVLSEQNAQSLRTLNGKEQLRQQARKELRAMMKKQIGEPAIETVYFTGFIIQ